MPKTYTVNEVADILGYSTNSIYSFLKERRIKGVRVGKGRFRIPEEELARILHLSKRPVESTVVAPVASPAAVAEVAPTEVEAGRPLRWRFTGKLVWRGAGNILAVPNIFDWFIGLGSVISGIGLFLFNQSNVVNDGLMAPYLATARIVLIALGIGIVVCNVLEGLHLWRRIFYTMLTLVAVGSVWSFFRVSDYDGIIIYGSMGLLVAVNTLFELDGITSILWYLVLLLIGMVVSLAFGINVAYIGMLLRIFSLSSKIAAILIAVVTGLNLAVYWLGYSRRNWLFCAGAWTTAIVAFGIAAWYGNLGYWSRAMYFIVLGFFVMLTPVWPKIAEYATNRHHRTMVHVFLARVSVVILIAIFGIYEIQQAMWMQRQRVFQNKIAIAERLLSHGFDTVNAMLTTTSLNADFVTAVNKKDLPMINQYAKILFESHMYVRRIIVIDAAGKGDALYPYGTFDQESLAFRDYFISVRNSRKSYTSSVFEALADHAHRQVVTISVPLISSKNDFVGVLSASVDLDQLNVELQQIADQESGESFTVADKKGQYVMSDDMQLVGQMIPETDPMRQGLGNPAASNKTMVYNGNLGIAAYDVLPNLGWNIMLRTSIGSVMAINPTAILSLLSAIVIILIITTWAFIFLHIKRPDSGGGSP